MPSDAIDKDKAFAMVTRPQDVHSLPAVVTAFRNEGYLYDVPFEYQLRRLKKLLGESRFRQMDAIQAERSRRLAEGRPGEMPGDHTLYSLLQTCNEAHVFYSVQLLLSEIANAAAYDAILSKLVPGAVMIDLGCYTGTFTRFVAASHPSATIHGCDALPNLIDIAKSIPAPENVCFHVWDHRIPDAAPSVEADALVSVLALPLAELSHPAEEEREVLAANPTHSLTYAKARELVSKTAHSWSRVAKPDATLCLITRAGTPALMLAVADGCRDAGWQVRKSATRVLCAPDEAVPLFVFDRNSDAPQQPGVTAAEIDMLWLAALVR
jgi:hypothetical protein